MRKDGGRARQGFPGDFVPHPALRGACKEKGGRSRLLSYKGNERP